MLREGEVRIPSGCAIAAIIDRKVRYYIIHDIKLL